MVLNIPVSDVVIVNSLLTSLVPLSNKFYLMVGEGFHSNRMYFVYLFCRCSVLSNSRGLVNSISSYW